MHVLISVLALISLTCIAFILAIDRAYVADKSQAFLAVVFLALSLVQFCQLSKHTASMSRSVPSVEMSSILNMQSIS